MEKTNKKSSKMKKFLVGTGVLLMIGSCGALISDEEPEQTTEEVATEESEELAEMREEQERQQKEHDEREAEKEAEAKAKAEAEKEKEEETEEPTEEETVEQAEQVTQEEAEEQFLSILNENMAEVADVEFNSESNTFRIIPTDPAMKDAIEFVAQGYMHDEFMELQYSMETLSSTALEKLGTGYSITLVNPHNTERELIVVIDGVTLYNAITEMQQ